MKLKYYKQEKPGTVGSYFPSKNWSKFTHFAVMEPETTGMIASVGYFQNLEHAETWSFDDYLNAAKSIEQAQLYAYAAEMFKMIERLRRHDEPILYKQATELLQKITDISEPATRLLGADAMKIIAEAECLSQKKQKDNGSK